MQLAKWMMAIGLSLTSCSNKSNKEKAIPVTNSGSGDKALSHTKQTSSDKELKKWKISFEDAFELIKSNPNIHLSKGECAAFVDERTSDTLLVLVADLKKENTEYSGECRSETSKLDFCALSFENNKSQDVEFSATVMF